MLETSINFEGMTEERTTAAKKELSPFPHTFAVEEIEGHNYLTVQMPFPQVFDIAMNKNVKVGDTEVSQHIGDKSVTEGTILVNGKEQIVTIEFIKYDELKSNFFKSEEGFVDNPENLQEVTEVFIPFTKWTCGNIKKGRSKTPTNRQYKVINCRIGGVLVNFWLKDPVAKSEGSATSENKAAAPESKNVATVKGLIRNREQTTTEQE